MRSLPSSIAQGNQIPTEWVVPESISNDCLETIDIMEAAGFPLMQWQRVRGGHGFGTPGYGDGFAADLHRLPFSSALVQG